MAKNGLSLVILAVAFIALFLLVSRIGVDATIDRVLGLVFVFGVFIPLWRRFMG